MNQGEKIDFDLDRKFRTAERTLEVKQFFKSRKAVLSFIESSILQDYNPPYGFLLTVSINEDLLQLSNPESMPLDGFLAISIN